MRNRFLTLLLVVSLLFACPITTISNAHALDADTTDAKIVKTLAFDVEKFYSQILTEEWRSIESRQGRGKALQLPMETLQSFDDETLAKLVYLYPFNGDYMAFDFPEIAFELIWNELNAMRVLAERENAVSALAAVSAAYAIDVKTVNEKDTASYSAFYKYQMNERALGIVLAQPQFATHATDDEQSIIADRVRNAETTWKALMTGEIFSAQQSASATEEASYVYTPNGTAVEVEWANDSPPSSWINSTNAYWDAQFPGATRVTDANPNYNCHSYGPPILGISFFRISSIQEWRRGWTENPAGCDCIMLKFIHFKPACSKDFKVRKWTGNGFILPLSF